MIFIFIGITLFASVVMFSLEYPTLGGIFLALALVASFFAILAYWREKTRKAAILIREPEWGQSICSALIARQISIDMTKEMVALSLGKPNTIDQREMTERADKERWVYGVPRQGAVYIWFNGEQVKKVKQ